MQEATVRGATDRHDGLLVCFACHLAPPCCTATRHVHQERSCGDTSSDALERGHRVVASPRQVPCRGLCLVAPASLPLVGSCRDARSIAASFLKCLGWPSRQAPLAGVLSFPASFSCRGLVFSVNTLFLNGSHMNSEGSWRTPGKPCRGTLRLPVHKFGVLRYPYFSTPTGAPGPGPYTVPSAVGPGPKQGTGTRGLGPH